MQPIAVFVLLDPDERSGGRLKAPHADDLDVTPDGDVRPRAPQQQNAVVSRERPDRQRLDLFDCAQWVMVIGAGANTSAIAPRFPWPWVVRVDDLESLAGFRQSDEIIDRAAVLD